MVYCNYKSHTDNHVVYVYGGETSDITGEIRFNIDGSSFDVIKEPENSTVSTRSLMRLFNKYKKSFSNREFKEKLSYEC